MQIMIGQLNPTIGAIEANVAAILEVIEQAKRQNVQLVIFPELSVPGYMPKDLLLMPDFIEACLAVNARLQAESTDKLAIAWGNISQNASGIGKPLYNTGFCAWNGQMMATSHKVQLPTYDVFDEARYFEPGQGRDGAPLFLCFGERLALTICEDLWSHPSLDIREKKLVAPVQYATSPLVGLSNQAVDCIINISASPYVAGKPAMRHWLVSSIARAQNATIIFANQVGANDDVLFDGHSNITLPDGTQWVGPGFENAVLGPIDLHHLPETPRNTDLDPDEWEMIDALIMGIQDYVRKTGFKKVFIGLSGGIDSSLTATLAQMALGPDNVVGVRMPSPYSSTHSLEDADELGKNLNIEVRTFAINGLFATATEVLFNGDLTLDLAEQNLQARLRGVLLMTLANRENGLVLATGNKSEVSMGYTTLYGDSCGALAPIGDIYKTQVYALCRAINRHFDRPVIPMRVLEKPPSAELAPNQKDSDSLPPYPVLDKVLTGILDHQQSFGEMQDLGYDESTILDTAQRILTHEYKRKQMPPILKVSLKAFGTGRMFPIAQQTLWQAHEKAATNKKIKGSETQNANG